MLGMGRQFRFDLADQAFRPEVQLRLAALARQSALATAEPGVARNAARRLKTGELLCRANNQRAAAKEFQVALKLLGASGTGTTLAGK